MVNDANAQTLHLYSSPAIGKTYLPVLILHQLLLGARSAEPLVTSFPSLGCGAEFLKAAGGIGVDLLKIAQITISAVRTRYLRRYHPGFRVREMKSWFTMYRHIRRSLGVCNLH